MVVTARFLDSLCSGTIDVQVVRENELTVLRGVCPSEGRRKKRYNVVVKLGAIRRHQKQLLSMQGLAGSHGTVAYNGSTQRCYNMSVAVARSLRQALLIRLGANALPLLWFHFPHRMIVLGCERTG